MYLFFSKNSLIYVIITYVFNSNKKFKKQIPTLEFPFSDHLYSMLYTLQ